MSEQNKDTPPPPPTTVPSLGDSTSSSAMLQVQILAESHLQMKQRLEQVTKEAEEKKRNIKKLEREVSSSTTLLQILEESVTNLREKQFRTKLNLQNLDDQLTSGLEELMDVKARISRAEGKYKQLEGKCLDFEVEKAIRVDNMEKVDGDQGGMSKEIRELKEVVGRYEEYKQKLASGDPESLKILNGDALVELEQRKTAVRDAMAKREARVEAIYMDIDEKKEQNKELEKAVLIKKKQNQAKLRRLQREVEDKEATANHLKQTAEYLQKFPTRRGGGHR